MSHKDDLSILEKNLARSQSSVPLFSLIPDLVAILIYSVVGTNLLPKSLPDPFRVLGLNKSFPSVSLNGLPSRAGGPALRMFGNTGFIPKIS